MIIHISRMLIRVFNYTLLIMKKYPIVLDSHKSIKIIIDKQLSVSRFGDGELMIIKGTGWGFQEYDKKLASRLLEVLRSDDPNIAICLPDVFRERSRLEPKARKFWRNQILDNLYFWNKYTVKGKTYLDTQFTRFYMDLKDKDEFPAKAIELNRLIWQGKDLLIIEGTGSRLGYNNDLFENAKSVRRILCPPENAFRKYDEILEMSVQHAKGKLVLLALGMTATVLAYDLAKKGFRTIDVGHIDIEYEWYRMKAKTKVPVPSKYMNEVSSRNIDEINDEIYLSQILAQVK